MFYNWDVKHLQVDVCCQSFVTYNVWHVIPTWISPFFQRWCYYCQSPIKGATKIYPVNRIPCLSCRSFRVIMDLLVTYLRNALLSVQKDIHVSLSLKLCHPLLFNPSFSNDGPNSALQGIALKPEPCFTLSHNFLPNLSAVFTNALQQTETAVVILRLNYTPMDFSYRI